MGRRKNKSEGLLGEISMSGFAGARQPKGLAETDRRRLLEKGHLSVLSDDPETEPISVPPVVEQVSPATRTRRGEPSRDDESVAEKPSAPARPRKKAPGKSRRAARSSGEFVLPPRKGAKAGARSCHFRLPEEIEAKLVELAEAHGCSKTHVVCAAIEGTWAKFDRQRRRAGG